MNTRNIIEKYLESIRHFELSIMKLRDKIDNPDHLNRIDSYIEAVNTTKEYLPKLSKALEDNNQQEVFRIVNISIKSSQMIMEDSSQFMRELQGIDSTQDIPETKIN